MRGAERSVQTEQHLLDKSLLYQSYFADTISATHCILLLACFLIHRTYHDCRNNHAPKIETIGSLLVTWANFDSRNIDGVSHEHY